MEEMELAMNQPDHEEVKKTESPRWYEGHISLEDAKTFIKANIATAARSFIAIGFYLKCVRDRELFLEENHPDVWEFARAEYGISKSTASRYMSMNDRFSENGNSPNVREEYRSYGKGQLQEMLYLEDDQLEQVTPQHRVEDIRNMRKPKEVPYIELPGQMEIEIDFPEYMPDPPASPIISQKQTFEMSVEDMLAASGQTEGIAISQQVEAADEMESQERAAHVKEQYRLQESFLYPFAAWLIKNHKTWFMEDHMSRVIHVGKSEPQLKAYLGASQSGFRSFGFPVGDDTYYAKMYDDGIEISHFTDTGFTVTDGMSEWFYLAASVQVQWNVVVLEEVQEEQRRAKSQEQEHQTESKRENSKFNSTPTSCPHREEYSCTVLEENRSVPGDGSNCGSSCCWVCKFQGMCKYECNASAGRNGEIPEYDAAWFVREWAKRSSGDLKRVLEACRRGSTNAERAKAVQECISPFGAFGKHFGQCSFRFHGFAGGMDFQIGKIDIHLKYGRFVQELMNLYPGFEESDSKEPETVIETPGTVFKDPESVPDPPENVIDGEFVDVTPKSEMSVKSILEEENEKLQHWTGAVEASGLKAPPPYLKRQKILVAALKVMSEEQSESEPKPAKQDQPELPILKNNDQRKEFIENYTTWPLWVETKETGERYYRYNLSGKIAMVVKVSWRHSWIDYKKSDGYEYGAEQYYLLGVGTECKAGKIVYVEDDTRTFYECSSNMSALVEYLKEFQKKK